MVPDQKRDAELLRLGLIAGTHTVEDAVAWADAVIGVDPHPDIEVIEVAMAARRRPAEVAALLRDVPGAIDPVLVVRHWLAELREAVVADPARAPALASMLYRLALGHYLQDPEMTSEAWGLEEWFEFNTHEAGVQAVLDYLDRHARRYDAPC